MSNLRALMLNISILGNDVLNMRGNPDYPLTIRNSIAFFLPINIIYFYVHSTGEFITYSLLCMKKMSTL